MNGKLTFAMVLSLSACLGAAASADDGLFSRTSIHSVFRGEQGGPPAGPLAPPPTAMLPAPSSRPATILADLVRETGWEPKELNDQVVLVKLPFQPQPLGLLLAHGADRQDLVLTLLLAGVSDEAKLPASQLLELMNANRQHAPAAFIYSSQHKRLELQRTLLASTVTAERLKTEAERLLEIARNTEALWRIDAAGAPATAPLASAPVAPAPANAPPAAPPPTATATPSKPGAAANLVGKWSAARSDQEAFALQLTADGRFALVHVLKGKQTRTTGKYALAGQTLTLTGEDGVQIVGGVAGIAAQQFQFTPQAKGTATQPLTFKRAS